MLQDITLQRPAAGWFFQLIESIRIWFIQIRNREEENYFLIN
jgi:hypothetical protein